MRLSNSFEKLTNFLGGYIAEGDLEGFESDVAVAQNFVQTESKSACLSVLKEGKLVLAMTSFPWENIAEIADRYFEDSDSAREWLQELIDVFESAELEK